MDKERGDGRTGWRRWKKALMEVTDSLSPSFGVFESPSVPRFKVLQMAMKSLEKESDDADGSLVTWRSRRGS